MNTMVIGHSINHYRQRKMWEWIAEQGNKVTCVVVPRYADEVNKPMKKGSLEVITSVPYGGDFWHFPEMVDLVKKYNPDVLMCYQEPFSYVTYHTLSVAKIYNKPFAFFTWENIRRAYPTPERLLESYVIKESDLAIGGNSDAARILLEKGGKNVEQTLQTGLDPNLFVPAPKLNMDQRIEPKKLLFVGRLVEEKGILNILKLFDKLDKNYILKFVGGRGPLEENIKTYPEFGKRITYEPWMDYTKLPEIYNWADILLVPSLDSPKWMEQCGYVIGEAMLCHVPVITSISKSIVELWKLPGVIFVPQGDIDLMLEVVLSDKTYEPTIDARQEIIKKYSYETIGKLYLKMLGDLI